jgi:hypothetical protein
MKAIVLVLALTLAGCGYLAEQVDYQKACASDPACLDAAKRDSELVRTIAGSAYPAAAGAAGAAAMILALWFRGRKLKTNQEVPK